MDIRTLRNFIVVAEEANIRRAALRLHITQPALTRQIKALEEEMGTLLFSRTTSGMVTTPAGTSFLHHARNITAEIELAKKNALAAASQQVHRLNVGVFGSATLNIIPEILMRFSQSHHNVGIILYNAREDQQIHSLRQGKILIAFDRNFVEEPDIACETVLKERALVALPRKHPLANRKTIDVDTLRDEPWIGGSTRLEEKFWMSALGAIPNVVQRVDDLLSALAFVAKGAGVCFAPHSLQTSGLPDVTFLPISTPVECFFELRCAYLRNERSPLLRALLEVIREYSKETGETPPSQ